MTTTVEQEQALVAARRAEQDKIAAGELQRKNHINAIATQIYCSEVGKLHGHDATDVALLSVAQFSVAAAVVFARSVLGYTVQIQQTPPPAQPPAVQAAPPEPQKS